MPRRTKWPLLLFAVLTLVSAITLTLGSSADEPEPREIREYFCAPGFEDRCAELNKGQFEEPFTFFGLKYDHPNITYDANPMVGQALAYWGQYADIRDGGLVASGADIHVFIDPTIEDPVLGYASKNSITQGCTLGLRTNTWEWFAVVAHEVGHCVGLGHTSTPNNLMNPYCCNPIGSDDIAGIRELYGGVGTGIPTEVPSPTPSPVPTLTPSPTPTPVIYRVRVPGLSRE